MFLRKISDKLRILGVRLGVYNPSNYTMQGKRCVHLVYKVDFQNGQIVSKELWRVYKNFTKAHKFVRQENDKYGDLLYIHESKMIIK